MGIRLFANGVLKDFLQKRDAQVTDAKIMYLHKRELEAIKWEIFILFISLWLLRKGCPYEQLAQLVHMDTPGIDINNEVIADFL